MILHNVVTTGIRNLLIANPELVAITTRIYHQTAPAGTAYPYILMNMNFGGEENDTPRRSFDVVMRVDAVSNNQLQAVTLAGEIDDALVNVLPTFPDGWTTLTEITNTGLWADTLIISQTTIYQVGGYYRLRGTK